MHTPTRRPFTLSEHARIIGGTLTVTHGPFCATHRGGECQCDPRYTLKRVRKGRRQ
jgi:hypothetical protein